MGIYISKLSMDAGNKIYKWYIFMNILINIKKPNPNWPYIPDHPCRILIIGGSGSGKINLINNQPGIDKI